MARTNRDEPTTVDVLGWSLNCYVCTYDLFRQRSAQLNTGLSTLFEFDWLDPSATCCVCARCGHIHWFLPQQESASATQAEL